MQGSKEAIVPQAKPAGWDVRSPSGLIRYYLCLLPLGALACFYGLLLDTVTFRSQAELASARFGWPMKWVEQDLSRYQPLEFPATLGFTWQRAWHDPIKTNVDWLAFTTNTLIFGAGVTACLVLIVLAVQRRARN